MVNDAINLSKKEETTMEIIKTASVEHEVECCGPMSLIS